MAEELEVEVTPTPEPTPEPAGAELTPTEPAVESGITLESLHALVLELQGTVQNLQAVADQATPVEPNAEEVTEEAPSTDDALLLEDDEEQEVPASEQDLEEIDALLAAN